MPGDDGVPFSHPASEIGDTHRLAQRAIVAISIVEIERRILSARAHHPARWRMVAGQSVKANRQSRRRLDDPATTHPFDPNVRAPVPHQEGPVSVALAAFDGALDASVNRHG
ncbi:MAG: hypothetical protein ABIO86_19925 [Sphingomonas sp.]